MSALLLLALMLGADAAPSVTQPSLAVRNSAFQLTTESGDVLGSPDLKGASFDIALDGGVVQTIRIDSVTPSAERPAVLLHSFSLKAKDGSWTPMCQPDVKGRQAGFPIAGRWGADGRFIKDPTAWFPACTSGAQGKCVLWGYDPWSKGPNGEDLAPYYEACIHMVRADYDGRGAPNTRNGTSIDVWDKAGVQTPGSLQDASYRFEAGWAPTGAVCVAKTRYENLLPREVLLQSSPRLGGACDEAAATARGALVFDRSR
jgi:hypothetical protein